MKKIFINGFLGSLVIVSLISCAGSPKDKHMHDHNHDHSKTKKKKVSTVQIPEKYKAEIAKLDAGIAALHVGTFPTINEKHAKMHERLGIIYFELSMFDDAENNLKRALKMTNNLPKAHLHLGRLYAKSGKLKAAVSELKEGLKQDATQKEGFNDLGKVYQKMGMDKESKEAFEKYGK